MHVPAELLPESPGERIHRLGLAVNEERAFRRILEPAEPGAVLLARKGEGTVEALERRRDEYRSIQGHGRDFVEVDATGPIDEVTDRVAAAIVARLPARGEAP